MSGSERAAARRERERAPNRATHTRRRSRAQTRIRIREHLFDFNRTHRQQQHNARCGMVERMAMLEWKGKRATEHSQIASDSLRRDGEREKGNRGTHRAQYGRTQFFGRTHTGAPVTPPSCVCVGGPFFPLTAAERSAARASLCGKHLFFLARYRISGRESDALSSPPPLLGLIVFIRWIRASEPRQRLLMPFGRMNKFVRPIHWLRSRARERETGFYIVRSSALRPRARRRAMESYVREANPSRNSLIYDSIDLSQCRRSSASPELSGERMARKSLRTWTSSELAEEKAASKSKRSKMSARKKNKRERKKLRKISLLRTDKSDREEENQQQIPESEAMQGDKRLLISSASGSGSAIDARCRRRRNINLSFEESFRFVSLTFNSRARPV